MKEFKDCSTHKDNVDLLIIEPSDEISGFEITTNNDSDFNIIWLSKNDALKLAYYIIEKANEL